MSEQFVIYKIINHCNSKVYIGQTSQNLKRRWIHHLSKAKSKKRNYIHNAINKYGKDNFKVEEIDSCADGFEADKKEMYWIDHYNSFNSSYGYNLSVGGHKHKILSEETKKKISKSLKGRQFSKEHKKAISEGKKGQKPAKHTVDNSVKNRVGKKLSDEHKKKLRIARRKWTFSEETKKKMSESAKGSRVKINKTELTIRLVENRTVNEMAERFNCSRFTIRQRIKENFNNMTVKQAKKYVREGNK